MGAGDSVNDVTLIRVDGGGGSFHGESDSAKFGFSLKYLGSGTGNANALSIFSDNQSGTQVEAVTVFQDGIVGINSTIPSERLDVGGTIKTEQLNVTGVSTFTGSISFPDSSGDTVGRALFGDSDDLRIYHDGNNSIIQEVGAGDLRLAGNVVKLNNGNNTATMLKGTDGGSVELNHNGSKKFETTASGIDVTGHTETDTLNVSGLSTFTGDVSFASTITFGDDDQIIMGDGSDLKLYHDGSNSYIEDTGTGALIMKGSTLRFRSTDNEKIINAHQNGSVDLFYDDSKKFETTGIGISVLSGTGLTATIAGPSNLILDPGTVGDNTGIVRIKGDLFVDGSTTQINSTSLEIADFIVGIASTATTDLLTDGLVLRLDQTILSYMNIIVALILH